MHRTGGPLQCGQVRPAGERPDESEPHRRGVGKVDLEEPLDRVAIELQLVDRLAGADVAELRRPVGGQHHQRDAGVASLDHGRRQVRRGRARRAGDRDWRGRCLGRSEREESRAALVDVREAADPPVRVRATARLACSATPAPYTHGACHSAPAHRRTRAGEDMCRWLSSFYTASPTPAQAGSR